jgi:hypothetical protein
MIIFYKRFVEKYLTFFLLGHLHDVMSIVFDGLSLVQFDQIMSDSKFQTDPCFKLPFMDSFVLTCDCYNS